MGEAYVKLHKKMLSWEWYDDMITFRVFIHCLLKADYKPSRWHGIALEPGQFPTSFAKLAKETNLTVQQVRTAMKHLKSTGEITMYQHANCSVVSINNWSQYQGSNKPSNKASTSDQQGSNKASTTFKEYKEEKNKKIHCFSEREVDYAALEEEVRNG